MVEPSPDLASDRPGARLQQLQVIATTEEGTRAALAEAKRLSTQLSPSRIVLLVPRIASLTPPDGPREAARITEQYRELALEAGVDATVRVCVGRRHTDVFQLMVSKPSVLVIGGRRRWWWHTTAQDIARHLRREGHQVVFAEVPDAGTSRRAERP